jgi:hypothetical protein
MPGRSVDVTIKGGPVTFARAINRRSSWVQDLEAGTYKRMQTAMERVEQQVVNDVEARVAQLYKRRTDARRRRYPSERHLHGSFRCQFEHDGFPTSLRLWSEARDEKVNALNYGSNPHTITGKNGQGGLLWFPRRGLGQSGASMAKRGRRAVRTAPGTRIAAPRRFFESAGAGAQASGKRPLVKIKEVQHPGIAPSYFMEIALEQGVERVLRKRVRLPRT